MKCLDRACGDALGACLPTAVADVRMGFEHCLPLRVVEGCGDSTCKHEAGVAARLPGGPAFQVEGLPDMFSGWGEPMTLFSD